jgi:hypothetical protein
MNPSFTFNTIESSAIPTTLEVAAAARLDGIVFRRNDVSWMKSDIHAPNGFKKDYLLKAMVTINAWMWMDVANVCYSDRNR